MAASCHLSRRPRLLLRGREAANHAAAACTACAAHAAAAHAAAHATAYADADAQTWAAPSPSLTRPRCGRLRAGTVRAAAVAIVARAIHGHATRCSHRALSATPLVTRSPTGMHAQMGLPRDPRHACAEQCQPERGGCCASSRPWLPRWQPAHAGLKSTPQPTGCATLKRRSSLVDRSTPCAAPPVCGTTSGDGAPPKTAAAFWSEGVAACVVLRRAASSASSTVPQDCSEAEGGRRSARDASSSRSCV